MRASSRGDLSGRNMTWQRADHEEFNGEECLCNRLRNVLHNFHGGRGAEDPRESPVLKVTALTTRSQMKNASCQAHI